MPGVRTSEEVSAPATRSSDAAGSWPYSRGRTCGSSEVAKMTDQNTPATSQYAVLPEPVRLEDTIASVETEAAPDPYMGRDTETEFMLRNAG